MRRALAIASALVTAYALGYRQGQVDEAIRNLGQGAAQYLRGALAYSRGLDLAEAKGRREGWLR